MKQGMKTDEIHAKAQKILDYINSKDPALQTMAVKTLDKLLTDAKIDAGLMDQIVTAIGRELVDGDSSIKNDFVNTACSIGKRDLVAIKKIVPTLFTEFDGRNRYRIGSITDFLARKATTDDDVIKNGIETLFRVAGSWLHDSNLAPIFVKFIEVASENNTRFVAQYRAEIDGFIQQLPPGASLERDVLLRKVKEHDDFMILEKQRRENEEKLRQQREADLAAAKAAKEKARQEELATRATLPVPAVPASSIDKPILAKQSLPEKSPQTMPESTERPDPDNAPQSSPFGTFSTMGLKRRSAERNEK